MAAAGLLVVLVALTTTALLLAPPIPSSIAEVKALAPDQLWCDLDR
jgi:hypothetical protein